MVLVTFGPKAPMPAHALDARAACLPGSAARAALLTRPMSMTAPCSLGLHYVGCNTLRPEALMQPGAQEAVFSLSLGLSHSVLVVLQAGSTHIA
jgi:hypothetical protein